MTTRALLLLWLLCMGSPAHGGNMTWRDLMPDGTLGAQVVDGAMINGRRTSIFKYRSELSEPEMVEQWKAKFEGKTVDQRIGGRRTVSGLREGAFFTMQVSARLSGGSEGTVAIADVRSPAQASRPPDGIAPPGDSTLLFSSIGKDDARRAEQFVYANRLTLHENRRRLLSQLTSAGYTPDRQPDATAPPGTGLLSFASRDREALITLQRDPGGMSLIVMSFTSTTPKKGP